MTQLERTLTSKLSSNRSHGSPKKFAKALVGHVSDNATVMAIHYNESAKRSLVVTDEAILILDMGWLGSSVRHIARVDELIGASIRQESSALTTYTDVEVASAAGNFRYNVGATVGRQIPYSSPEPGPLVEYHAREADAIIVQIEECLLIRQSRSRAATTPQAAPRPQPARLPWDATTETGRYYGRLVDMKPDGRIAWFHRVRAAYERAENFDAENDDFFEFVDAFCSAERFLGEHGLGLSCGRLVELIESAEGAVSSYGRGANPGPRMIDLRGLRLQLARAHPSELVEPAADDVREVESLLLSPAQELELTNAGREYLARCRAGSGDGESARESRRDELADDLRRLREVLAEGAAAIDDGDAERALHVTASATPILEKARGEWPEAAIAHSVFFPDGVGLHVAALRQLASSLGPAPDPVAVGAIVDVALPFAAACDIHLGPVTSSGMMPVHVEQLVLTLVADLTTTLVTLTRSVVLPARRREEIVRLNSRVVGFAIAHGTGLRPEVVEVYEASERP